MAQQFNDFAKQIADELIVLTKMLDSKMETWADVFARQPDSPNASTSAGFITNQEVVNPMELLVDVQLTESDAATLRAQAIETIHDEKGNERFNNIS